MTNKLLVNVNSRGNPALLEQVAKSLCQLGRMERLQPTLFSLSTNVTKGGVRSLVRSMLEDEADSVCVAVVSEIVVQSGLPG